MTAINSHLSSENSELNIKNSQFTILCVDDDARVLKALKRLLRSPNYRILTAIDGQEGLQIASKEPIDIIISDMKMPAMNGAEFLGYIAKAYPYTVRILLTGYSDISSTIAAVNSGQIARYVQKPWNNEELLLTLSQCVEKLKLEHQNRHLVSQIEKKNHSLASLNNSLEEKVKQRTLEAYSALGKLKSANALIKNNLNTTIRSFYNLISLNPYLGGESSLKICELCSQIAHEVLDSPKAIKDIQLSGLLCELGMLSMNKEIWNTPIEELSIEQKKAYLLSSQQAYLALSPATHLKEVATILLHQHDIFSVENFPNRISTDEIPLGSRILSVARDYIYATSGRLYKTRLSSQGAIDYLTLRTNKKYDPEIVNLLPKVIELTNHNTLATNEKIIAANDITPGMSLSRDVLNSNNILLLPEGHMFNTDSLTRLKNFLTAENNPVEIFVLSEESPFEKGHDS